MSPFIYFVALGLLAISSTVAVGPSVVNLGTAANYAILAQSGVSTVPPSSITGDIGLDPAAATFLTGFSLTLDSTRTFATSIQVVGKLFAASYAPPTPVTLTTAVSDLQTAYNDASSRPNPTFTNFNGGALGGFLLSPGLYKWTGGVTLGSDVTIFGGPLDTWIFQVSGTFNAAAGKRVTLLGGALAKNIVWAVGDVVTVGAGAHLEGVVLGKSAVTLQTGATVNGRILAQTFVALQKATVVVPL